MPVIRLGKLARPLAVLGAVAACSRTPEPAPRPAASGPVATTPTPKPAAATDATGITWKDPAAWQRIAPTGPMRKASWRVPRSKGDSDDADLALFYFGPKEGGSVSANVERWVSQFSDRTPKDPTPTRREINGMSVHVVEIEAGTYSGGMPGASSAPSAPKPGWALLGAVVEAPSGKYFWKLVGPRESVKSAKPAFGELLDSVAAK